MQGSSGGPRVLVVDDVDEVRVLIHRALSTSGYQVDVAATLAQAQAMDPGGYDAVLVDSVLGPDRGIDLIETLRSEDPAAAGRCLVLTGGTADGIPADVPYLTKPFRLAELLDAVQALHQLPAAPMPGCPAGDQEGVSPDSPDFPDSAVHRPVTVPPAARQPPAADPVDPMDVHIDGPIAPSMGTSIGPAASGPAASGRARAGAQAWQLLGIVRRLRERERHELVDFLHDGPIQGLTAVALDLQMARSQAPVPATRFAAALRQLDATAGSLRWLVDGHWTSLMAQATLADALRQRTAWLLAAPATVHARAAVPTATEIPVIVDVAELMLLGILPASPPMRADVAVQTEADEIRIELALTAAGRNAPPASDQVTASAALGELAFALGAAAHADIRDQPWRARLVLPRQPAREDSVKK